MTATPAGLASVIVPCLGSLETTRRCLAALVRNTRPPWELVAIADDSSGRTAAYLAGVKDAATVPVTVIAAPPGSGPAAAWSRGLRAARGGYLLLLDSAAVVTDAWLDQLVALAESDPAIGLAGPMSNDAAPPQVGRGRPVR